MVSDTLLKKQIRTRSKTAKKYDYICRDIEEGIAAGRYAGQLPGVTLLAKEYCVNPITVCKALNALEERGVVEKISRVGTFVKCKKRIGLITYSSSEEYRKGGVIPVRNKFHVPKVFNDVLEGIYAAMNDLSYTMLMHSVAIEDRDFIEQIKSEVDGLLVLSGQTEDEHFEVFAQTPWVKVMGDVDLPRQANHVTYDNNAIGEMAADYLLNQDCERFFYFGGAKPTIFEPRYLSFKEAIEAVGGKAEHIDLDISELTLDVLMERAVEFFRENLDCSGPKPGIFLSSCSYVVPVYQLLYSLGIKPMQDVTIITCENIKANLSGVMPKPAVIDLRMKEIGKRGVELLLNLIGGKRSETFEKVVYSPQLLDFSSKFLNN